MEFGMFHEFQRRPGQTEAEAFTESFEQVDEAERAGLDVMWLAELHTAPERSVLAADRTPVRPAANSTATRPNISRASTGPEPRSFVLLAMLLLPRCVSSKPETG